jgi:hypothetical protein
VVLDGQEDILDYGSLSALVLVKAFSNHDVYLAEKAHANAVPVIIDLCDNVLESGYGGDQHTQIVANFLRIAKLSSALVVTGPGMREALSARLPGLEIVEIVDQVEREDAVRSLIFFDDWRRENSQLRLEPKQELDLWTRLRLTAKKMKRALKRKRRSLVARLRLLQDRLFRPQLRMLPTLLWFGTHASSTGRSGLITLAELGPELQAAYRVCPFKLLVVSDSRRRFKREIAGIGVPVQYKAWDPLRMFQEIRDSDVALLPNSKDSFSVVKSANRAVLSLSLGTPAVATMVPSLEPFDGCMLFDNWKDGIIRYLTEPSLADLHVKSAQRLIETLYGSEPVADGWNDLLSKVNKAPAASVRGAAN